MRKNLSLIKQYVRRMTRLNFDRGRLIELWLNKIYRKPIKYTDKYGISCHLYPGKNNDWILNKNSFFDDPGVLKVLDKILKPGMTVLDVGANRGAFCLYAGRL